MDDTRQGIETEISELLATTSENADARETLQWLVEQATLRRIATLVAAESSPDELFAKVVEETAALLGRGMSAITRDERDGTGTIVAFWHTAGANTLIGSRVPLDEDAAPAKAIQEGRPVRVQPYRGYPGSIRTHAHDLGIRAVVACPIVVSGSRWGVVSVGSLEGEPYPPASAEAWVVEVADLLAIAIANAQSREALARLADEQAALRRVATLVAEGVPPADIFSAVGAEMGRLFKSTVWTVGRFETGAQAVVAVGVGTGEEEIPSGTRWELDDSMASAQVFRTGRPARVDGLNWSAIPGPLASLGRRLGIVSTVATPLFVDGRLWGVLSVSDAKQLPPDAEARLVNFGELVGTAIANAESKSALAASRRRIVVASDEARRQIERDLHDGVQQQLVSLTLSLERMEADPPAGDALKEGLASATRDARCATEALVEVARGIHPWILTHGGLEAALQSLADRSAVHVELVAEIDDPLPDAVEVAAYYVASEALTNVAKHAFASVAHVDARTDDGRLTLVVRDDGVGGAARGRGSGLVGLQDRVETLGGMMTIDSTVGGGTCVVVTLPITTAPSQGSDQVLGSSYEPFMDNPSELEEVDP